MRQYTLNILLAIFLAGCNGTDTPTQKECDMAVTAQSVSTTLTSTNVTDSTDVFNNTIRQNYPYGTKYKYDNSIFMNSGDDVNVTAYNSGATYILGQIVYKDSLVKKCTGVVGDFPKQPEEYASVDTSFDNSVWDDRYMKFADIPTGVSLFGENFNPGYTQSIGGFTYPFIDGFDFSADGLTVYFVNSYSQITQYSLSVAYNITTAIDTGKKYTFSYEIKRFKFSSDGLKLYTISDGSNYVRQYALATAWDISTINYTSSKYLVDTHQFNGIAFSSDGAKMYLSDAQTRTKVYQYSLATAWDISKVNATPTYTLDTSANLELIKGIAFSSDGASIVMVGSTSADGQKIVKYPLSTAWYLSSKGAASVLTVSGTNIPAGTNMDVKISSDGTKLFLSNLATGKCNKINLTTAYTLTTAIYSLIPFTHSEERGGVDYDYILSYASGNYTFTSKVNGTADSYTPMTAYTELDGSSIEDKAYIGSNGTWLAKTLILRDNAIYIRTTVDAPMEWIILTDYQFSTVTSPSQIGGFSFISATNDYKPFDEYGTTQAVSSSPMTYTIETDKNFNSFTLVNVVATSLTYTIYDATDTVVKTETLEIDCLLDDYGLLPQSGVTMMICADEVVAGGKIEIELTNDLGDVKLGGFSADIAIDEGLTLFDISTGARDYNDYTPDAWGNIPEGVKARTKTFTINVKVPYSKFDRTYRRHLSYLGKFITIDGTDALRDANDLTLYSLVAKGLITAISHKTEVKNGEMDRYYSYNMTFLETT